MESQIYELRTALENLIENRSDDVVTLLEKLQASIEENGRRLSVLEEYCFGKKDGVRSS